MLARREGRIIVELGGPPGTPRHRRVSRLIPLTIVASVLLTACAPFHGASATGAASAADEVAGLHQAAVSRSTIDETFGSKNMVILRATAEDELPDDRAALAERLLRITYAVGDWRPTSGISIVLRDYDGTSLGEALEDSGWTGVVWESDSPGEFFVTWPVLQNHFGSWPGRLPPS